MTDAERLARIQENIYWWGRAHFMAANKHQERINQLMKGGSGEEGNNRGMGLDNHDGCDGSGDRSECKAPTNHSKRVLK